MNLKIFYNAVEKVPAYKKFLKDNSYSLGGNKMEESRFWALPIMDKKNYLAKYPFAELFPKGKIPPMICASSGSSGKQTFWLRCGEQERDGGDIHETIFRDIFKIRKEDSTLVVICFSMGIWVAGNYTLASCRSVAERGYNISSISPGIEKEDIFNILKNLSPQFKNVVLAGYPPFIMDILSEASKRRLGLDKKNIKILLAGDKFSEDWRESVAKLLNMKSPESSIIGLYGSADASVMAFETPASIFLRKEAEKNKNLFNDLFVNKYNLPALVQYNPSHIYFEEVGGELIITAKTAIPLIRYNMHDSGKVIHHKEMAEILKKHNLLAAAVGHGFNSWSLPFLTIEGRTDVAVTFYALNIYPENIKAGIDDKKIEKLLTGNFFAYTKSVGKHKKQKLHIQIELKDGIKTDDRRAALIERTVIDKLIEVNAEFRKLRASLGDRALPIIELIVCGDKQFATKANKGLVYIKGKKPKMILKTA